MPIHDGTHFNMKRMHVLFAVASLGLLFVTVWMWIADSQRPWKDYQREHQRLRGIGPREPAVEQIDLPGLPLNYHFRRVARFDRCTTCHLSIDRPGGENLTPPYRTHPRLDLFVGAHSPHPMSEFGCTVCHDGQGSATDFRWASHTPNDATQGERWRKDFRWSDNPNWDLRMRPQRFSEAGCLKCHPNATDLEPTRRFGDPPTAKLMAGYHLVRQHGCFGCHEIPAFAATTHKVGPSLRHIRGKSSADHLAARLRKPSEFLPSTRMPQLFGLVEHLSDTKQAETTRSEAQEIRAAVNYLLQQAEGVHPPSAPTKVTEAASVERGKRLFETQGCLACHQHEAYPQGQAKQGPDLTTVGAKYAPETGAAWLTGWLRDPSHYTPQTLMPNPLLQLMAMEDGKRIADPVTDLAAFLLASRKPLEKRAAKGGAVNDDSGRAKDDGRAASGQQPDGRRVLATRGCAGCHDIPGLERATPIGPTLTGWGRKPEALLAFERVGELVEKNPSDANDFFGEALRAQHREGFLWQKLLAPRSFDYRVAEGKPLAEQLKMGRFELTDAEREAILTFILAQEDDGPSAKYVHQPSRVRQAVIDGRKVIDKYACAECHTLELERWKLTGKGELLGTPRLDRKGHWQQDEDDDGNPIYYFTLWEPATIDGKPLAVGGADVPVAKSRLAATKPALGGGFLKVLSPSLMLRAGQVGASQLGAGSGDTDAWNAMPPVLVHEGAKVQPDWLYRYLLEPGLIRPAAALRMPRFTLSPNEAAKLTDYFAATANVDFPYTPAPIKPATLDGTGKLDRAMKLVQDRATFCAKCHSIGNRGLTGSDHTVVAPRLDDVARRLRPEYVRRWLRNPRAVLPYTPMPVLFPQDGPALGQDLFPGSAQEQLDAVVELLLRYDEYLKRHAKG